jgi:diguanylate cyclase (GGDEF)-like protein
MFFLTWLYAAAGAMQILALLAGIHALIAKQSPQAFKVRWLIAASVGVGALLTLPWASDPEVNLPRLFLRAGSRYLLGGLALLAAAVWVLRTAEPRAIGRRVTGWVLALYATELLIQAVVAVPLMWGVLWAPLRWVTPVHGLFEVVVYPMLGVGLVSWLLDNENQRRRQAELRLGEAGRIDPVTALANESGLLALLGSQDASAATLGLLGLDQFRLINEARGMRGGDDQLRRVAAHLRDHLPHARALARLGGDEFVIVLPPGEGSGASFERVRAALGRGSGGGQPGLLSGSLGWTPLDGIADLRAALGRAGSALRCAKQEGGGRSLAFRPEMLDSARDWVLMEEEFEEAFASNAFVIYLQPLVAPGRATVLGYEALLRWHHPQRGVLGPDQFLPSLRTLRQMQRLDALVIEQAARLLAESSPPRLPIAVNIGADTLLAPGTVELISAVLKRHGIAPHLLQLEVTEETAMRSLERGVDVLQALRALGVEVAVDDFGSGFSSLTYLTRLPIARIKFDRQFLTRATEDAASRAVLAALVPLMRKLGLRCVAEGVETLGQRELAESLGFDELQGYLFGRPELAGLVLMRAEQAIPLRLVSGRPEGG